MENEKPIFGLIEDMAKLSIYTSMEPQMNKDKS